MQQVPLYRTQIFFPQLFDMDECPLAAAKGKVLNSRQHQEFVFVIPPHIPSMISGTKPSNGASVMS